MGPIHPNASRRDEVLIVGASARPLSTAHSLYDESRARISGQHERLFDRDSGFGPLAVVQARTAGSVGEREGHEAPAGLNVEAALVVQQEKARSARAAGRKDARDLLEIARD